MGTSISAPQFTGIIPPTNADFRKLTKLLFCMLCLHLIAAGILTTSIDPLTVHNSNASTHLDTPITTDDVRRTVKTLYSSIYTSELTLDTVCGLLFHLHSMLIVLFLI